MEQSDIRILVVSPASYRAFRDEYPSDLPVEQLLYEQHRHRYFMFSRHLGWKSTHIFRDDNKQIECDRFDRDNTIYSIAIDHNNNFLGSVRAYSTMHPYMLEEDEFKNTCYPGFMLPKHPDIYEGSRIVSANSTLYRGIHPIKEIRIGPQLLLSHMEIGRLFDLKEYIATMPPVLLDKLYRRIGWSIHTVGDPRLIRDNHGQILDHEVPTQNYIYPVDEKMHNFIMEKTGIRGPVSYFGVSKNILPKLLNHMKAHALLDYPHRFPHMQTNIKHIGHSIPNLTGMHP